MITSAVTIDPLDAATCSQVPCQSQYHCESDVIAVASEEAEAMAWL